MKERNKKMLNVEKGNKVILKGFTGIKLGVFEVEKVTEKSIVVLKKNGEKMVFSKKTGVQTNVEEGKEKYANSIMEDDGSYVRPQRKNKSKKVEEPVDDVEVEEEEEKPAKKTKKVKKAKKVEEPEPVEVEDDETDEWEDEE